MLCLGFQRTVARDAEGSEVGDGGILSMGSNNNNLGVYGTSVSAVKDKCLSSFSFSTTNKQPFFNCLDLPSSGL